MAQSEDADLAVRAGQGRAMNGRAWVVEFCQEFVKGKPWVPGNAYAKRVWARKGARNLRLQGFKTRVRQYIRQPEVRP